MKFGLNLGDTDPRDQDPAERWKELLERARMAKEAGFDSLYAGHHYWIGPAKGPGAVTLACFQPLPLLARLAAESGDMLLVTTLLLSLYHPVQVAEEMATLDVICGGRLRFSIGLGWMPYELEAFGIRRDENIPRFEEGLQVVKKLLTEDEVNFEGKYFTLRGMRMNDRPIQKPYPPIWIGAMADASVKRAARLGDSWMISSFASPSDIQRHMAIYRATLAELGKPFPQELAALRIIYLGKDRETVQREVIPVLQNTYQSMGRWGWFLMQKGKVEEYWQGVQSEWIVGEPDHCIEQIARYEELGINHVIISHPGPDVPQSLKLETIRLMGERVLPYFKK
ncbi:MAG: LLM class flavin-dependent oxidoreductase [Chloroflexi bacterium]|nr:LLM class flavin-dependent oxidoreductase [Chloroflexota bacterium]